jgi:hypothetical protein
MTITALTVDTGGTKSFRIVLVIRPFQIPRCSLTSNSPYEVRALLVPVVVRGHNSALSGPQEASSNLKKCTGEDVKTRNIAVNRGEEAEGIDTISNTTEGDSELNAELVGKRSTKETDGCEDAICIFSTLFSSI